MEKRERKKEFPIAGVAIGAAAVILLICILCVVIGGSRETEDITQAGIAYLEALEKKDPDTVSQILRQRRQAELEAQREELLRQVKEDEIDPFTLFQDAVIMGDSRAVGFCYYGFVDESRTLTSTGATILEIRKQMDALEAKHPAYIYLCYGINDLKTGYWGSKERYVAKYMEYIAEIQARMPNAVVVVSSTLPYYPPAVPEDEATEPTEEDENAILEQVPEWNAALAAACAENGIIYVDNTQISTIYQELWGPDGIHMKKAFYPHWGKNLVVAALEEGGVQVEEDAL